MNDVNQSEEIQEEQKNTLDQESAENFKDKEQIPKKKNKKKKIILIVLILIILILGGLIFLWSKNQKENDKQLIENEKKELSSPYKMSSNDLQDFDLYFLQLEKDNKNIAYSPLSIKYTLEMLNEGAKGKTKEQLTNLLGNYQAKEYINSKNMSFANAMFIKNTYKEKIKEDYINKLVEKYKAQIIYDTFNDPTTVNSWVDNKTFGLIKNLVNDVSDKKFLLVNALAIDMEWNKLIQSNTLLKDNFSVHYTHENFSTSISPILEDAYPSLSFNQNTINAKGVSFAATINNYDIVKELGEENIRNTIKQEYSEWLKDDNRCSIGEELGVDEYVEKYIKEINENYKQVESSTDFQFYSDDSVKVFAKDLKEYNQTTLQYIGIMPKTKNINDYIKEINAKELSKLINQLKTIKLENFDQRKVTRIIGTIPLFKIDYQLKLIDDLKSLGITDVFEQDKANLKGITSTQGIFIDEVKHKTNIEFSNEGIKAAAATELGGAGATSCGFDHLYDIPVETIDMTFDQPYMFLIRDKNSGEVWFTGKVEEPIVNNMNNSKGIWTEEGEWK